jgi:hypothetical protein
MKSSTKGFLLALAIWLMVAWATYSTLKVVYTMGKLEGVLTCSKKVEEILK